jgi:putative DNA methylase
MSIKEANNFGADNSELLISKWFPITEVSVESVRERGAASALPPLYFLHVWFARRPLVASRAAVLGSLLPASVKREDFLSLLGIPADIDLQKAQEKVAQAKASGVRTKVNPFFWERAYKYTPSVNELEKFHAFLKRLWNVEQPLIVDPMAGGGSIPFEAMRLGLPVVAGDLNPVAFVCLKGTLEYPARFGKKLISEVESFCKEVHERAKAELEDFFPKQPSEKVYAYLWARTIKCSSCGLIIPLSPNWWIVKAATDEKSVAVRLLVPKKGFECSFEIVKSRSQSVNPDKGTVKGGRAECPRCYTVLNGDEVKLEAQNARMGHQIYCVCVKNRGVGKKWSGWDFRAPTKGESAVVERAEKLLEEKLPFWKAQNLVPIENFPETANDTRPIQYGMPRWCDLFNHRQLLTHLTYLEKFLEVKERLLAQKERDGEERDFAVAIITYAAIVFDTCVNYNSLLSRWQGGRGVRGAMDIQAFPFRWSFSEWNQLVPKGGYEWALSKVLNALREIIQLLPEKSLEPTVYCGTSTKIPLPDKGVPCIVVDPPYAANVMYAEVSDFFYVWLKRLLADIFPKTFNANLTEKDEEAVANLARFKGMGRSAKKLAREDYKTKMESCFN